MSSKLDFTALEEETTGSNKTRKWRSREPNPVVQMSLRMPETTYERFREHCVRDRRTNGEMLEIMMKAYEKVEAENPTWI